MENHRVIGIPTPDAEAWDSVPAEAPRWLRAGEEGRWDYWRDRVEVLLSDDWPGILLDSIEEGVECRLREEAIGGFDDARASEVAEILEDHAARTLEDINFWHLYRLYRMRKGIGVSDVASDERMFLYWVNDLGAVPGKVEDALKHPECNEGFFAWRDSLLHYDPERLKDRVGYLVWRDYLGDEEES